MLCCNYSAGIGRTGTFIGLDYLVEEARATKTVDVFQCVRKMRDNRINMVQTPVSFDSLTNASKIASTQKRCVVNDKYNFLSCTNVNCCQ